MLMLKRNTATVVKIFLTDSTDHITPYDGGDTVGRKAYLDLLSGSSSLTVNADFIVQHRLPATAGNGYELSLVAGASLALTSESGSATVITFNSGVTTARELADFIDANCTYLEIGFMNVVGSTALGGSDAFAATALANGRNNINGDSLLMYTVEVCKETGGWRKETFGTASDRIKVMCPISGLNAGTPRTFNRDSGELHLHVDAALLDSLGEISFRVTAAGGAGSPDLPAVVRAQVVAFDPDDAVRLGMSTLPSVAFGAVGGFASMVTATGTAQAGTTSTITLEAGASATTSHHNGDLIHIVDGAGVGQSRLIKSYLGGTRVATVTPNWTTAPDNTSVYVCRPWSGALEDSAVRADAIGTSALSSTKFAASTITSTVLAADAITAAKIAADAITEIQTGLATATAVADVQTDVDDIQARLPAALVGGRMDASVGAMAADTVTASALATDAVTEIQAGLATSANQATLASAIAAVQTDTDDIQTRLPAALVSGRMDASVGAMAANTLTLAAISSDARTGMFREVVRGTATAGAASTITLDAGASTTASIYNGCLVSILSGTGAGQTRRIRTYTAARLATIIINWVVTPDATSQYVVWTDAGSIEDNGLTTNSMASATITAAKFGSAAITSTVLASNSITSTQLAADAIGASQLATDAVTEIQSGLATSTQVDALEGDTTELLMRLSTARAGYLDNLNIGGLVASSTEVTSIQNNTRVVRVVPDIIERPDSGTATFRVELFLYDSVGNMETPDSAPTISLVNQTGTDLSARLDSTTMTLVSTGWYRALYTASTADALDQLLWAFSVIEGGATRTYGNNSLIVDTTAADFTTADRAKLDQLAADYTTARAAKIDNLDATVSSRLAPTVSGRTLDVSADGEAGLDWANVGSPTTVQNLSGTTIKRATDNPTALEIDTQLSAAHGAGAWGSTMTTSQIATAVWNALLTDYAVSGSMGEALALVTGLSQGNYIIDQASHGVNGQTTARIRLFRSGADVGSATDGGSGEGEFATYVALTEYVGPNKIKIHRVARS